MDFRYPPVTAAAWKQARDTCFQHSHSPHLITNFHKSRKDLYWKTIQEVGLEDHLRIGAIARTASGDRIPGYYALERTSLNRRDLSYFWRVFRENEQLEQKETLTMKRSDLKTGMRLVFKNGKRVIVMKDTSRGDTVVGDTWFPLNDGYQADLQPCSETYSPILYIYDRPFGNDVLLNPQCKGNLLWEAPAKSKEMTVSEIEKALGYSVKVVK